MTSLPTGVAAEYDRLVMADDSSAGGSSTTRDDRTANMDTSRRRRCAEAGTNRI